MPLTQAESFRWLYLEKGWFHGRYQENSQELIREGLRASGAFYCRDYFGEEWWIFPDGSKVVKRRGFHWDVSNPIKYVYAVEQEVGEMTKAEMWARLYRRMSLTEKWPGPFIGEWEKDGHHIVDLLLDMQNKGLVHYQSRYGMTIRRWAFDDGSAIIVAPNGWDLEALVKCGWVWRKESSLVLDEDEYDDDDDDDDDNDKGVE